MNNKKKDKTAHPGVGDAASKKGQMQMNWSEMRRRAAAVAVE